MTNPAWVSPTPEYDLLKGEWIRLTDPIPKKQNISLQSASSSAPAKKKNTVYQELLDAMKKLNDYTASMKEASNNDIRHLTEQIRKLMD